MGIFRSGTKEENSLTVQAELANPAESEFFGDIFIYPKIRDEWKEHFCFMSKISSKRKS